MNYLMAELADTQRSSKAVKIWLDIHVRAIFKSPRICQGQAMEYVACRYGRCSDGTISKYELIESVQTEAASILKPEAETKCNEIGGIGLLETRYIGDSRQNNHAEWFSLSRSRASADEAKYLRHVGSFESRR